MFKFDFCPIFIGVFAAKGMELNGAFCLNLEGNVINSDSSLLIQTHFMESCLFY